MKKKKSFLHIIKEEQPSQKWWKMKILVFQSQKRNQEQCRY